MESFGWNVHKVDGHNYNELLDALNNCLKKWETKCHNSRYCKRKRNVLWKM